MVKSVFDCLREYYDDDVLARTRAQSFAEGYKARSDEESRRLEGAYPSLSGIEASAYGSDPRDWFSLN